MKTAAAAPRLAWFTSVAAVVAAALLAACASKPPPPDWQMNARSAAERLVETHLSGDARLAALELARLRGEIARTGRPDLLARAELLRCAAQVASVEFDDCPAYRALEADAGAPERAYAAYLAGRADAASIELLPAAQQPLARPHAASAADAAALQQIEDPLSRLVAAGVLLRSGQAHPAIYTVAVDTASARGWRRPLLAWLKVQEQRAQAAGDAAALSTIQRRITLVESVR
jgi:hypothetical protein